MKSSDPDFEVESKEIEYRKVIVNIPKPLLDTFDLICKMKFYSRKEAIKQSMREFIKMEMGDEWTSPLMQEYENKLTSESMTSIVRGLAKAANNPEIKKAQLQNKS